MASGITKISDIVVPELFADYIQQETERKDRLILSGAVQVSPFLNNFLSGGGLTINVPGFTDLDQDEENVATDDESVTSTPNKIGTATEIAVRCSRNQSWSSMDLAAALAGPDPLDAIGSRVVEYWLGRRQAMLVATMNGVIADNTANDSGDYTNDISASSFSDGVTNFSAEALIDAAVTMGDSMDDLGLMMVHSIVYARMQKNNLIDFIPDARGEVNIPVFHNRVVIVDDTMPKTGDVYDTWLFGAGAIQLGVGSPKEPVEVDRVPAAGNGSGQEILYTRTELAMHPTGHAYTGTAANGGPSNAATTNNLAAAGSWNRVYSERKQIKFARLVTREA